MSRELNDSAALGPWGRPAVLAWRASRPLRQRLEGRHMQENGDCGKQQIWFHGGDHGNMPLSEICIPIRPLGTCNCLTLSRPVQQRKAGKELAFGMTGGSRINLHLGSYWMDGPS